MSQTHSTFHPTLSSRLIRYWPAFAYALLAVLLLWLQPAREISAALVALAWLGGSAFAWRRSSKTPAAASDQLLVAYASQGGQAQAVAERSAEQLTHSGMPAVAMPLNALTPAQLTGQSRLLLVLGTYGEGEAPDNAARFERRLWAESPALRGLEYALLALGDSEYQHFCGFARRLEQRLRQLGATPLFDRLEADRADQAVLRRWQQQLGQLSGNHQFSDWQPAHYQHWTLEARECLNPGSQGAPAFYLRLAPPDDAQRWQAGDIAEIGPCQPPLVVAQWLSTQNLQGDTPLGNGQTLASHLARRKLTDPVKSHTGHSPDALLEHLPLLPHRDYSIASCPPDGHVELLVRLMQHSDGTLGLGSGWLCRHAPLGTRIDLRIRANPGFRLAANTGPLILIGNGTGLAGLRAHLREREQGGQGGHWLLFGERNAAHDGFFEEELNGWLNSGHLARLDRAFSRDQAERVYVQHLLRDAADEVRVWIDRGASVLVCGSLEGMGREVDSVLRGLLGEQYVEELSEAGRYRRDLY
jgi:sulfite reductase (NADPH) flavoprotein alpha-component